MIASAAMVLDLTYEQAAEQIPIQDMGEILETGVNKLGIDGLDSIEKMAEARGRTILDLPKPFALQRGFRYLAVIPSVGNNPLQYHVVAVDENGIVFDPDHDRANWRKRWTEYDFVAVLEVQCNPTRK
jgi:hypothetical protein